MNAFGRLIFFLIVGVLAGCANKPAHNEPVVQYTVTQHDQGAFPSQSMHGRVLFLQCPGGYEFPAYIQKDTAWLFLPEGTKRLVSGKSTGGDHYSNGEYSFLVGKDDAVLIVDGLAVKQCRNNEKKAVWEEAKLRGADFRAVGIKGEWSLELSLEGNTVFIGDQGNTRILFKTPDPIIDREKMTSTYNMNNGEHHLVVKIEGKSCHDPISGQLFDTSVTLHLDKQVLKGCGRAFKPF
ncbi:MAG: hypothetical protein PUP46_09220 [Endozoicomonas sp. (ex Botrylloides leachii)]|nr:hypothetical protein [Endozoicomonas sp. (ex Botrylloides leachii)]